ncbi:MAG: ATP-binding cassette domain-containing protein [Spirochaetales bacterium]|nr:ATP-binding cassette domain-containing protein [Spirochaetales bacterium]
MINVENLQFTYPKQEQPVLTQFHMAIQPGEIYCLLGPSGTGKSTIVGILTGAILGYEGKVSVAGNTPGSGNGDFQRRIGVCFEAPYFYPRLTAKENLLAIGNLYGTPLRKILPIMERLGLQEAINLPVNQFSK